MSTLRNPLPKLPKRKPTFNTNLRGMVESMEKHRNRTNRTQ
jgi:hypothetical protein